MYDRETTTTGGSGDLDIIDELDSYLEEFCSINGINPGDMKNPQFNGALLYIYRLKFKPARGQWNNRGCIFDYETEDGLTALCRLADGYIALALKYNKMVTLYGFQCLSGVNVATLQRWSDADSTGRLKTGGNGGNITKLRCFLVKSLLDGSREYVRAALADTNIGLITLANNDKSIGLEYNRQQLAAAAELLPSENARIIAERRHLLGGDTMPQKPV